MSQRLQTRRKVLAQLLEHTRRQPDRECCGLLAGQGGVITQAFPVENAAREPAKNYEIAPAEIIRLMREFRAAKLEFLGIYHSHPTSDNAPSPRDIELAYYSEEAYFIISPLPDAPKPVRAFSIRDGHVIELEIQII